MSNGESEKLVEAVAERVRAALTDAEERREAIVDEAERRAAEIVSDAEARAKQIVAEAEETADRTVAMSEDQARERIERARKALDELGLALGNAPSPEEAPGAVEEPVAEEPEPGSDPSPEETPEPAEPQGSDPSSPTTEELIAQLKGAEASAESGGGPKDGGDAAARLVAMNMALDGASREEVDARLAEEFELADRETLLDEVFSRVKS